ncbi:sugar ABC transporter permease [Mobiluncus mulieris]|uniref:sugar ABC transporter permease n=1 Tax=Mobiluncus mulieris TaxID=2052 RepID=UPI0021E2CB30|nr:ABC transporter permease subunit [Mobiluncus mulieris]MCU9973788.1 ABC transporter permease subunit [Mobiluncus mulieris]MCV0009794.1 ABC transporter permease subunit [Mobiluncus mulieris]
MTRQVSELAIVETRANKEQQNRKSGFAYVKPKTVSAIVVHLAALAALFWALFPILFVVSAAFNPAGTLSTTDLLPRAFSIANFQELLSSSSRPFGMWFLNSIVICLANSIIAVLIGALSAFAFSRLRFKGRRQGLMLLLLIQLFPGTLSFIALYMTFDKIGDVIPQIGLNTTAGLILAYSAGSMGANIWLLKGYFDTIPTEIDDAAAIDGISHVRFFFQIIVPLTRPILVTVFILSFVSFYSEFMLAGLFLQDAGRQTLAVGLNAMLTADRNVYFGQFCAGALLASIPVVVIYFMFQNELTGGLTQGSVK